MQRAQAILIVLALLATPLSLFARTSAGMSSDCNNLCCLPHGSHAAHSHAVAAASKQEGMSCHHGAAGHRAECTMKAGHHAMDYGFFAPIAPTTPSAIVRASSPASARLALTQSSASLLLGFTAAPFQPPRS
ncbi:MAG: hypothetical protein ACRD59_06035 [Candidatus Acidiferrales bacterium]